jgi:hypothetical protein
MKLRDIAESMFTQKMRDAVDFGRAYSLPSPPPTPNTGNETNTGRPALKIRGRRFRSLETRPGAIRL